MSMPWFKFYKQDFLTDTKIIGMDPLLRQVYITMLCLCDDSGEIKDLREYDLIKMAGCDDTQFTDDYDRTKGCLEYFKNKKMIEVTESNGQSLRGVTYDIKILSYDKRQGGSLSNAERQAIYRERHKNDKSEAKNSNEKVTKSNEKVTLDKIRLDKIRESKPHAKQNYLLTIPDEDIDEFTRKFVCTPKQVKSKGEELLNYCKAKNKKYSDYKAFLRNALSKDFGEREASVNGLDVIRQKQLEYEAEIRRERV